MNVTVYSKPICVQCKATKRAFDKAGVEYEEIDLSQDEKALLLAHSQILLTADEKKPHRSTAPIAGHGLRKSTNRKECRKMIIAVVNQKGGVGKTTVAVNLANRLAQNARVLLVDCDPQGDATGTCGVEVTSDMNTLNDVMAAIAGGVSSSTVAREAIVPAGPEWGFDIIPANRALVSRETDTALGREFRLQTALEGLRGEYEHIVLDCPPALGMMTSNALVAADMAVVVTHPRETATNGVAEVFNTIHAVRRLYNPKLKKIAIVINEHIKQRTNVEEWTRALREYYGDYLIEDMLPKHEHIAKANSDHKPITAGKEECVDNVFAQLVSKCQH